MSRRVRLGRAMPALLLGLLALPSALQGDAPEAPDDRQAIAAQRERFLAAWLDDDRDTVMACFADDAVLVPHAGVPAVVTKAEIRAFYWSGPPSAILEFHMKPAADLAFDGTTAYEYGRYTLAFELAGDPEPTRVEGNYVSIWTKGKDGVWRYALRTWNHG